MAQPTEEPSVSDADERSNDSAQGEPRRDSDVQPTPFDHPLFLPALFAAGCVWFAYDAYLNQDPDLLEHLEFNRFGLRVVAYATAFTGYQGYCELRNREPSPWSRPLIHLLFALWFAYDAFLNGDPWYEPYQAFNVHAALALGLTSAGLAVWASRREGRGDAPPGFTMAMWVMAMAVSFGYRVVQGTENALLFGATAAGLAVMSIWIARRAFEHERRRRAAGPATGAT
jgi:hypothetical protein